MTRLLDRQGIAAAYRISLSYVDKLIASGLKPRRPGVRGKHRALYARADVRRALRASPSRLAGPIKRLVVAQQQAVVAELARLESEWLPVAVAKAVWGRSLATDEAVLRPWPAAAVAAVAEQLAAGVDSHRLAVAVQAGPVADVLARLAQSAPIEPSANGARRVVVADHVHEIVTTVAARANLLDARAQLSEARTAIRRGGYVRVADVGHAWRDRVLRARAALWNALPARIDAAGRVDAPTLRRLLDDAGADALAALRGGPDAEAHEAPTARAATADDACPGPAPRRARRVGAADTEHAMTGAPRRRRPR
ncbi:MAG: hypothetical protein ACREVS_06110 [Burkholderiales bacterium]